MIETEKLISDAVDNIKEELYAFIQEAVRFASLPDHEHDVQELMTKKLQALNLKVDIFPCLFSELENHPAFCDDGFSPDERIDVVARWKGTEDSNASGKSLVLNGHVDVAPIGDLSIWHESPWTGAIKDGKLYGRGSCDMKSGLSAAIFAIQALQEVGFRPASDVLLESVIGEESGGIGTLMTIIKGYTADAAIILEPTDLTVCPIQAGALTFRLTVPGRATHAAMKKDGVSAIEKFDLLLHAIQELETRRHQQHANSFWEDPTHIAPINLGTIHGGEWHSTVPEKVVVEGRFGVFPEETSEKARQSMEETILDIATNDPWLKDHLPIVEWFEGQFESGITPVDHPAVQMLLASHKEITGKPTMIRGVTYGSDLRLFTNHAKIPAVLYGPGNVSLSHAANEYVDLMDVVTATKVVAMMIVNWCGGEFT